MATGSGSRERWLGRTVGGGIMDRISPTQFLKSWGDVEALKWLVSRSLERDIRRIARSSRETTTHYKWLLAKDEQQGTRVWLHQFKPLEERRPGYAGSIHNHRYPFQSMILAGGYTNAFYRVRFEPGSLKMYECCRVSTVELPSESTYSMDPTQYHALDEIEPTTQTVVVEFAPDLAESYSVAESEERVVRHVPLEVRAAGLVDISATLKVSRAEWSECLDGERSMH